MENIINPWDIDNYALALLDACGRMTGRVCIDLKNMYYIKRDEYTTERAYIRACIIGALYPLRMFISRRFERTTVGYNEARPSIEDGMLSFFLEPILLLPIKENAVLEFHEFLNGMRPFFVNYATKCPRVNITNNRDHHRRTYGKIEFLYNEEGKTERANEFSALLDDFFFERPMMQQWLKAFAIDLNKLGPWSWATVSSEMLFDRDDDPCFEPRRSDDDPCFNARRKAKAAL